LLLLASYNDVHKRPLDGLTKLAKLDFLVRYPKFLQDLTEKISQQNLPNELLPTSAERLAVESRMVRYKYGPWDDRYYPILGTLIGLGLVAPISGRGRIALTITKEGAEIAELLSTDASWRIVAARCRFTATVFNMTGNKLKELIYKELPAVTTTRHRRPI
jgi:hypothetical protein